MDNKEIDLFDLIKRIITFYRKNFWFFLILVFVGAGLGFGYSKTQKSTYKSSGVYMTWLEADFLTIIIDLLESQVNSNNFEKISENTKIPVETLQEIISMEHTINNIVSPLPDERIFQFVEYKSIVKVETITNDTRVIDKIEKVITSFFDNNETIRGLHTARQETLRTVLKEIDYELETHKKRNDMIISQSSRLNTLVLSEYKISSLLDIVKLKNVIEFELDTEMIFFVQDFTSPVKVIPNKPITILLFIVFLIIAGTIFKLIKTL